VIVYPTLDEVISVHTQLIARFGGSLGIRDRGALESALVAAPTRCAAQSAQLTT
jgi:prophage maintenance system killer protein